MKMQLTLRSIFAPPKNLTSTPTPLVLTEMGLQAALLHGFRNIEHTVAAWA